MTGKEGYPTWAYDCSVDHNKQLLEVHGRFRGATNDKTVVRDNRPFVDILKNEALFVGHEYTLKTRLASPEDTIVMKRVHGFNHRGYHKWPDLLQDQRLMMCQRLCLENMVL
jgi:hypothetical protein